MSKKILVIETSLRPKSNTDILAKEFVRGASDAGNEVDEVTLKGKTIGYCTGCQACTRAGSCHIRDDATEIVESMRAYDILAFATPVYYYGMAAQMKALLDRTVSLFGNEMRFKDVYLISAAAEPSDSAFDRTVDGLQGWIDCFPGTRIAGVVRGGGLEGPGEAGDDTDRLKESYELGLSTKE